MKLYFVTQNKHKFSEVEAVLKEYGVELEQINMSYYEDTDDTTQEVARKASKELADRLNKPLIVEDTGMFFKAYKDFPGVITKRIFNAVGYKGLLKLLEGESRDAYFLVVIGYCEPGKEPELFEGKLKGRIAEEVFDLDKNVMPYERIFVPSGYTRTLSSVSREEKNTMSHRAEATRKLGEYLKKVYK